MYDADLSFLSSATNEDLKVLVDYITLGKSGSPRLTETLTGTDEYKRNYPYHLDRMTGSITDELQRFGGNTFANILRGHGVPYRTILVDVCKKMKVSFNKNSSVEVIEGCLLQHVLIKTMDEMPFNLYSMRGTIGKGCIRLELPDNPFVSFFTGDLGAIKIQEDDFKALKEILLARP